MQRSVEPSLLWPLDPQQRPHEVVATIGEVRAVSTQLTVVITTCGLDVFGAYGDVVRLVRSKR